MAKQSSARKRTPKSSKQQRETWVVLNDLQMPFEDKEVVWDLVVPFVRDLKPYGIVLNGDIVDNYEISDFTKDPKLRKMDLKAEREGLHRLLGALAPVSTERWYIEGNHEQRFQRYSWSRVPELVAADVVPTFAEAFKLEDFGFKHKVYGEHINLGKLMVTHGFAVRQHSAMSAKAHFDRLGTSVLLGHTHRLGIFHRTNQSGDHAAYENGCLCRLDGLGYAQFPDWQQGLAVVDVFAGGLFNVQQLRIIDRRWFVYGDDIVSRSGRPAQRRAA
jgi:hypothetical protein